MFPESSFAPGASHAWNLPQILRDAGWEGRFPSRWVMEIRIMATHSRSPPVPRSRGPPPCSLDEERGTNLGRLGDFCLLVCFALRCPCNCLLNPAWIIFYC